MRHLFTICGLIAIAVGLVAFANIRSDIQFGVGVTAVIGGLLLIGQARIMAGLGK